MHPFIKHYQQLFSFFPTSINQSFPHGPFSITLLEDNRSCPCCGHHLTLRGKDFRAMNFPYLNKDVFEFLSLHPQEEYDSNSFQDVLPSSITGKYHMNSVQYNRNDSLFSLERFMRYQSLLKLFQHSPYFTDTALRDINKYSATFPSSTSVLLEGVQLRTYFCKSCYSDIFLTLENPHTFLTLLNRESGIAKNQKEFIEHERAYLSHIYTMTALSVALVVAFGNHSQRAMPNLSFFTQQKVGPKLRL